MSLFGHQRPPLQIPKTWEPTVIQLPSLAWAKSVRMLEPGLMELLDALSEDKPVEERARHLDNFERIVDTPLFQYHASQAFSAPEEATVHFGAPREQPAMFGKYGFDYKNMDESGLYPERTDKHGFMLDEHGFNRFGRKFVGGKYVDRCGYELPPLIKDVFEQTRTFFRNRKEIPKLFSHKVFAELSKEEDVKMRFARMKNDTSYIPPAPYELDEFQMAPDATIMGYNGRGFDRRGFSENGVYNDFQVTAEGATFESGTHVLKFKYDKPYERVLKDLGDAWYRGIDGAYEVEIPDYNPTPMTPLNVERLFEASRRHHHDLVWTRAGMTNNEVTRRALEMCASMSFVGRMTQFARLQLAEFFDGNARFIDNVADYIKDAQPTDLTPAELKCLAFVKFRKKITYTILHELVVSELIPFVVLVAAFIVIAWRKRGTERHRLNGEPRFDEGPDFVNDVRFERGPFYDPREPDLMSEAHNKLLRKNLRYEFVVKELCRRRRNMKPEELDEYQAEMDEYRMEAFVVCKATAEELVQERNLVWKELAFPYIREINDKVEMLTLASNLREGATEIDDHISGNPLTTPVIQFDLMNCCNLDTAANLLRRPFPKNPFSNEELSNPLCVKLMSILRRRRVRI